MVKTCSESPSRDIRASTRDLRSLPREPPESSRITIKTRITASHDGLQSHEGPPVLPRGPPTEPQEPPTRVSRASHESLKYLPRWSSELSMRVSRAFHECLQSLPREPQETRTRVSRAFYEDLQSLPREPQDPPTRVSGAFHEDVGGNKRKDTYITDFLP